MPPEEDQLLTEDQPLVPDDVASADMDGESPLIPPEVREQIAGEALSPGNAQEPQPLPAQVPQAPVPQAAPPAPDMANAVMAQLQAGAQREQQLQDQLIRQTEVARHVNAGELQEDAERIVDGQYQEAQQFRAAQDQMQWHNDRYDLAVRVAIQNNLGMSDLPELLESQSGAELAYRARMKAQINNLQNQVNSYNQRQVRPQAFDSGVTSTPQSVGGDDAWLAQWNMGNVPMTAANTAKANRIIEGPPTRYSRNGMMAR